MESVIGIIWGGGLFYGRRFFTGRIFHRKEGIRKRNFHDNDPRRSGDGIKRNQTKIKIADLVAEDAIKRKSKVLLPFSKNTVVILNVRKIFQGKLLEKEDSMGELWGRIFRMGGIFIGGGDFTGGELSLEGIFHEEISNISYLNIQSLFRGNFLGGYAQCLKYLISESRTQKYYKSRNMNGIDH